MIRISKGLPGSLAIVAIAGLAGCGPDPLKTLMGLVFPETRSTVVSFPLDSNEAGGVYGKVVDAKGTPVEGALVTFGTSKQSTGLAPTTLVGGAAALVVLRDSKNATISLQPGEFALLSVPAKVPAALTVTYDDVSRLHPVTLKATNSFVTGSNPDCRPCGLQEVGDLPLDLVLPKKTGLRLGAVSPGALTATATGSAGQEKTTFEGSSLVAFTLRNSPKADAVEVANVSIDYRDEDGNPLKTPLKIAARPVTKPTVIGAGGSGSSGTPAVILAELGDSRLAKSTDGNVSARVQILVRSPGSTSDGTSAKSEDDTVIEAKIGIIIKR